MSLFLLSFLVIMIPLSYSSIAKFNFDVRKNMNSSKNNLTLVNQNDYLDKNSSGLRIQRAAINSFVIENNTLELYISSYKRDESLIRDIQTNSEKFKTIMAEVDIDKIDRSGLYQIFIDDKLVFVQNWLLQKGTDNSQKFLSADIPVDNFSSGIHTLKIDRVRWRKKQKDFIMIENWASIPFKRSQ